jgi:hypothetical protein
MPGKPSAVKVTYDLVFGFINIDSTAKSRKVNPIIISWSITVICHLVFMHLNILVF